MSIIGPLETIQLPDGNEYSLGGGGGSSEYTKISFDINSDSWSAANYCYEVETSTPITFKNLLMELLFYPYYLDNQSQFSDPAVFGIYIDGTENRLDGTYYDYMNDPPKNTRIIDISNKMNIQYYNQHYDVYYATSQSATYTQARIGVEVKVEGLSGNKINIKVRCGLRDDINISNQSIYPAVGTGFRLHGNKAWKKSAINLYYR